MKLLVGVDLSESTEKIVRRAEEIAKALSAKVWVLHIVKPEPADVYMGASESDSAGLELNPQVFRDSLAKRYHAEHRRTQEIANRLRDAGLDTTALLVQGETVETMLEEAAKLDVNMIVVGSHGRGAMYQLLVGSISEGVLHGSECPVLVVPTRERTSSSSSSSVAETSLPGRLGRLRLSGRHGHTGAGLSGEYLRPGRPP